MTNNQKFDAQLKEYSKVNKTLNQEDENKSDGSKEDQTAKDLDQTIANEQKKENILDSRINRKEKVKYALWTFRFMVFYIVIVIFIVVWVTLCDRLEIQPAPLSTLITTIPSSMVLFGWVIRGLFK